MNTLDWHQPGPRPPGLSSFPIPDSRQDGGFRNLPIRSALTRRQSRWYKPPLIFSGPILISSLVSSRRTTQMPFRALFAAALVACGSLSAPQTQAADDAPEAASAPPVSEARPAEKVGWLRANTSHPNVDAPYAVVDSSGRVRAMCARDEGVTMDEFAQQKVRVRGDTVSPVGSANPIIEVLEIGPPDMGQVAAAVPRPTPPARPRQQSTTRSAGRISATGAHNQWRKNFRPEPRAPRATHSARCKAPRALAASLQSRSGETTTKASTAHNGASRNAARRAAAAADVRAATAAADVSAAHQG